MGKRRKLKIVVEPFVDNDRGASSLSKKQRPAFEALINRVRRGDIDVILAYSSSRLTRRPREFEDLIRLAEETGVIIYTDRSGDPDFTTADGRALARTLAAWDAREAEHTGEKVSDNVQRRLTEGFDLGGRRAFGFDGRKTPTVNEAEAGVIRAGIAMILDGASVYAVAEAWNATGIRPPGGADRWRTQTVRSILLRPRNVGRLVAKGVDYGVKLPAIVSEEDHAAVAAILNDPSRRPKRGKVPRTSTALGVVRCGVCGGRLETTGSGPNGELGVRCADRAPGDVRRHPIMNVEALEKQLSEAVLARVLSMAAKGDTFTGGHAEVTAMRLKLADIKRQRDREQTLGRMAGANLALVAAALADFGQQIDALNASIEAALAADASAAALAIAHDFVTNLPGHIVMRGEEALGPWAALWASTPIEQRRNLVRAVLKSVELLPASRATDWRLRIEGGSEGFPWATLESLGWIPKAVVIENV